MLISTKIIEMQTLQFKIVQTILFNRNMTKNGMLAC